MHQVAFHPEMNRNTIIHLMLKNQDKLLLYGPLGSDKLFFFFFFFFFSYARLTVI